MPDEVVEELGSGRRPPVVVSLGGHTYRTTVASMGGSYWIPLAAEKTVEALRAGKKTH